jgi:hypothetical protein
MESVARVSIAGQIEISYGQRYEKDMAPHRYCGAFLYIWVKLEYTFTRWEKIFKQLDIFSLVYSYI